MKNCYVLMPFKAEFDIVYKIIEKAARESNMNCWRADKKEDLGLITQSIIRDILVTDVIVADISTFNPNVLYELGVAHVLCKPTIILSQELESTGDLPFDISHMNAIPYALPEKKNNKLANQLKNNIKKQFNLNKINHNPVSITLNAERLNLANHFKYNFLWGYEKTLKESIKALEAWVISSKLYWERLDGLIYKEIIENRILTGKRIELVMLPDNKENRHRKEAFINRYITTHPKIEDHFRILFIDDDLLFYFLSTEITIYDANTPNMRGIILEPMAFEGVDAENDLEIAKAIINSNNVDKIYYNLRENTFDIAIPKIALDQIAVNYKVVWNAQCKRIEKTQWII